MMGNGGFCGSDALADERVGRCGAFWRSHKGLKVGRWYRFRPLATHGNFYEKMPRRMRCIGDYGKWFLMEDGRGVKWTVDRSAIGLDVEVREDGKG